MPTGRIWSELIDGVGRRFPVRRCCASKQTAIRRTGEPGPIFVEADPVQLGVALAGDLPELARSPAERRPHRNRPRGERRKRAQIRIRDDGPGIKPEERRHLFDPFYSARQAGRGLGLGLSKAWRIVTNHGGRIDV